MLEYPIQYGDLWTAGHHTFLCGDIERDDLLTLTALLPVEPRFVYSDPPTSKEDMEYWHRMNGEEREGNPELFWNRLCTGVASSGTEYAFIEQGRSGYQCMIDAAKRSGLPPLQHQWDIWHGSPKSINRLLLFSGHHIPACDPTGKGGDDVVRYIFSGSAKEGDVVLDPCVGSGTTARIAHEFGMRCWGMDINPIRLSQTLKWLQKQGCDVERIQQF